MDFLKTPLQNPAYAALKSIPLSSSPNSLSPSPSTSSYTVSPPSIGRETHHPELSHTPSPPLLHLSPSFYVVVFLSPTSCWQRNPPSPVVHPLSHPTLSLSLILCSCLPLPLPRLLRTEKPTIHGHYTLPLPLSLSLPLPLPRCTHSLPLLTIVKPTIRGYRRLPLPLPLPLSQSFNVCCLAQPPNLSGVGPSTIVLHSRCQQHRRI